MRNPVLSHQEAKRFYDWFGAKQDWQRIYEDPAVSDMIAHGAFDKAQAVFEFGCGTGRLAHQLLEDHLPPNASYHATDLSETMVALAENDLAPFSDRTTVQLSPGDMQVDIEDASIDRFVSTYVLDLLAEEDIHAILGEAHRILTPGGLLCLTSLSNGATPLARLIERAWVAVHFRKPQWLGGCRPISLQALLEGHYLTIEYHNHITSLALTSEILIASK